MMDTTTFQRLIDTYQDMVYDVACRLLNDREGAAAVVDRSIAELCWIGDDLDVDHFRCHLLTNVIHGCMESVRSWRRTRSRVEPSFDWDGILDGPRTSLTPLLPVNEAIDTALLAMDVEGRVMLLLHDRYDCSDLETAAVLGIPAGAVRKRLIQARIELRNYLIEHSGFPPMGVCSHRQS